MTTFEVRTCTAHRIDRHQRDDESSDPIRQLPCRAFVTRQLVTFREASRRSLARSFGIFRDAEVPFVALKRGCVCSFAGPMTARISVA